MKATTHIEEPQLKLANRNAVEIFPGIVSTPGVCGGRACVGNTRITVSDIVEWRQLGLNDARLLYEFPSLTQDGLTSASEYARLHMDAMEREIAENNED